MVYNMNVSLNAGLKGLNYQLLTLYGEIVLLLFISLIAAKEI